MSRGTGFEGGHLSTKGLSPGGQIVTVPTHRHAVELDFVRYEVVLAYRLSPDWHAWLRAPYDVKQRRASVETVDPATQFEIEAMRRNLELHHPSETLEGFSDFSLLAVKERADVIRAGDSLTAALGTSLPVGRTEEDPYVRGDAGLPHEHIQFGTGTFDPLLEVYYSRPLSERWTLSANALGKFPFYENDKGYRGALETSANLHVSRRLSERANLRAGWSFQYQRHAHWNRVRDINSGLVSNGLLAGASYRLSDDARLALDVRVPISQRTLSDDGDAFEQGTVVQLGITYSL